MTEDVRILHCILFIVTARKRSLGQGNVFTGVCLSTGGVPAPRGWSGLGGCLLLGECACSEGGACSGGACSWGGAAPGGVPAPGGAYSGRCLLLGGACSRGSAWWRPSYCCGPYASYWNAFLFICGNSQYETMKKLKEQKEHFCPSNMLIVLGVWLATVILRTLLESMIVKISVKPGSWEKTPK